MKSKREVDTRCKACGSTQTYIRLTTKDRFCRTCGNAEPLTNEDINHEKKES